MSSRPHIVCAVRGRLPSEGTIRRAIELAGERDARLTFFHVITVEFVEHATVATVKLMYRELHPLRVLAMLQLCQRARDQGVPSTDYMLREGNVRQQLQQYAQEIDAQMLVMGMPAAPGEGRRVFTPKSARAFAQELEARVGLNVVLV